MMAITCYGHFMYEVSLGYDIPHVKMRCIGEIIGFSDQIYGECVYVSFYFPVDEILGMYE